MKELKVDTPPYTSTVTGCASPTPAGVRHSMRVLVQRVPVNTQSKPPTVTMPEVYRLVPVLRRSLEAERSESEVKTVVRSRSKEGAYIKMVVPPAVGPLEGVTELMTGAA